MRKIWTREKIIEGLLKAFGDGIPITRRSIEKFNSKLNSAIQRKDKEGERLYFGSYSEAREALVMRLEALGKFDDARQVGSKVNTHEEWSNQKIINRLIAAHKKGVSLSRGPLKNYDSQLCSAIERKNDDGSPSYFGSHSLARIAAFEYLEFAGKEEEANELREAIGNIGTFPEKITEEEWEIRRGVLKQKLLEKIAAKEDVSIRQQRKVDGFFENQCTKAFGRYRDIFSSLGLDYDDFSRYRRKGESWYLTRLFSIAFSTDLPLDAESIIKMDAKLAERLKTYFGGYYGALKFVHGLLQNNPDEKLRKRADPNFWQEKARKEGNESKRIREGNELEKVLVLNRDKVYDGDPIRDLDVEIPAKGSDLWVDLNRSPRWASGAFLARLLGCHPSNITSNVILQFPERSIKYHEGGRVRYSFHRSIVRDYKRKNP